LLDKATVRLASEKPKFAELEKIIAEFEPISAETIADLKTQQRVIAVDLAGVTARVEACAAILKRGDVRSDRTTEQVESIKIAAEIELVGLTARMKAMDKIVQQGTKREHLVAQLRQVDSTTRGLQAEIRRKTSLINQLESARKNANPLPIPDNRIVIRPIKWEALSSREQ
jgi:hypothetical protein